MLTIFQLFSSDFHTIVFTNHQWHGIIQVKETRKTQFQVKFLEDYCSVITHGLVMQRAYYHHDVIQRDVILSMLQSMENSFVLDVSKQTLFHVIGTCCH